MYEVELKVRADHEAVRTRLQALGAEQLGHVVQEDVYYDAPHRDFASTDEALRVRTEADADGDEVTKLTYKGALVEQESKTRREAETAVTDPQATRDVLAGLGFEPAATVRKERDRFAVRECIVTLDAVDDLGEFVEVETDVASEGEVAAAREGARALMTDLDLDPTAQIRTSYLGLLLESNAQE